jgi:hypothetical protein
MSLSNTSKEAIAHHQLFKELRIHLTNPPMLLSDNQGALATTEKPAQHHKTKHIRVCYHFIWDTYHQEMFHPLIKPPIFSQRCFTLPLIHVTVLLWCCFSGFMPTFMVFFPTPFIIACMHYLTIWVFALAFPNTHTLHFMLLGALPLVMLKVFTSFFLKCSTRFFTSFPHQSSFIFLPCTAPTLQFSPETSPTPSTSMLFHLMQISHKVAWVFLFNKGSVGYHASCRSAEVWPHLGCNA